LAIFSILFRNILTNLSVDETETEEDSEEDQEEENEGDQDTGTDSEGDEDEEVEEVSETMKKASFAKTAAAGPAKKKVPTPVKAPVAKKDKVEKDLRDEIPWEKRFYCDFISCTHSRIVHGTNKEMLTVKFFPANGRPTDYKCVIHPSGQYLDLLQTQPEWHRSTQMIKEGYKMAFQRTADCGVRVSPLNVDKIQAFRDAFEVEKNNYPDGIVVKTMRIKLSTQVKTEGFATCEGPNGYLGYSYEIQTDEDDVRTCVFTVDMFTSKPPPIAKPAEPAFYFSDTNTNNDDEDYDVRPRPQPPPPSDSGMDDQI
jgi:hypothetical protein